MRANSWGGDAAFRDLLPVATDISLDLKRWLTVVAYSSPVFKNTRAASSKEPFFKYEYMIDVNPEETRNN